MYKVVHISSGIVAVTFNNRQYALDWITENNCLLGVYAEIYKLINAN